MISYIKGVIKYKTGRFVVVEVNGVGYQVFCPEKLIPDVGNPGDNTEFFVKLFVRDDALELYGFEDIKQLELFEILLGAQGIGPKAAQAIIGVGSVEGIIGAIERGDEVFFKGIPGVGSKKIKKVILELSGKLPKEEDKRVSERPFQDAHKALVSLGFSTQEAKEALESLPSDVTDSKDLVRKALKLLGKQGT